MIFGKEMAQPSIVFTGKKGLACIKEIMNAKPVDKEYELSIRQSLKEEELRILKARASIGNKN